MTAVTIERIAAGGDGVGRLPDGLTVFVPRTAPADQAEVEIVQRKRRYAKARLESLARPGPTRTTPECPHFAIDGCGGCQLQHLTVDAQVAAKRQIVGEAVRRIGRRTVADPRIVSAPSPWRYRTKITLAISADAERIGFHRYDRPGDVFELDDCRLAREVVMDLWRALRPHRALFPRGATAVVLREDTDGGLHTIFVGGHPPFDPGPLAAALGRSSVTVWWQPARGAARVVAGRGTGYPALAFAQVHPALAGRLRSDAITALGSVAGRVVWDLYGGVGETARALAEAGARVWSIDADRRAIEWARKHPGGGDITYVSGRVEESLSRLPAADAVILNPPRGGTHARVTTALDRWASTRRGARLVYVSCDPATLARDLARMPSITLDALTAYDLFPQTAHVEALAVGTGTGAGP